MIDIVAIVVLLKARWVVMGIHSIGVLRGGWFGFLTIFLLI